MLSLQLRTPAIKDKNFSQQNQNTTFTPKILIAIPNIIKHMVGVQLA
jgi:hypothetical protein